MVLRRAEKSTAEWRAEHAELAGDAKKHKDELQEATTARDKLQEEMNTAAEELVGCLLSFVRCRSSAFCIYV